jgi:nitrogen-specific signal transduction histidine kinase
MRFFLLGSDCVDNATIRDFAVSVPLVAIDEENYIGAFGNASTNAIGELAKRVQTSVVWPVTLPSRSKANQNRMQTSCHHHSIKIQVNTASPNFLELP